MTAEIFNDVALFTSFALKQESPVDGSLNTDQMQGAGLDPDQIKWAWSGPTNFSSLNPPIETANFKNNGLKKEVL